MRFFTPRRLLRLYPRRWRRRYGAEFLALLESAPITRPLALDVLRNASREWFENTFAVRAILAPCVVTAATFVAMQLTRYVPTPPTIVRDGGQTIVSPPWPVSLGFLMPVLILLSTVPLMAGFVAPTLRRFVLPVKFWIAACFIAATTSEWGDMVLWLGTDIPQTSVSSIWWKHLLPIFNCLNFSLLANVIADGRLNPPLRLRPDVPVHPLGLSNQEAEE